MRPLQNTLASLWGLAAIAATLLSTFLSQPAHAEPVLIETEGLGGIDVAQRDSDGILRLFAAEDDNADGLISFVADLDPLHDLCLRTHSGASPGQYPEYHRVWEDGALNLLPDRTEAFPFLITGTEERVITDWNRLPTMPFTLGQSFSVVDGRIPGLDALVYRVSLIESIVDVVDLDLSPLPLYTGPMQVGGLVRLQVVPEPSSAMLFASASCGVAILRLIRRRQVRF